MISSPVDILVPLHSSSHCSIQNKSMHTHIHTHTSFSNLRGTIFCVGLTLLIFFFQPYVDLRLWLLFLMIWSWITYTEMIHLLSCSSRISNEDHIVDGEDCLDGRCKLSLYLFMSEWVMFYMRTWQDMMDVCLSNGVHL